MAKITGIGGVFFKAREPQALRAWYERTLGLRGGQGAGADFVWRCLDNPERLGRTVWAAFDAETDYFGPGDPAFMINYRVDDLDGVLAQLRAAGAEVDERVESHAYGRFGWATDPEGNRMELWEPSGDA